MAILTFDKVDFRAKKKKKYLETEKDIMIQVSIHQKDTTLNIYSENSRVSKYLNQKLTDLLDR